MRASIARGSTSTPGRRVRGALVSVETGLAVIVAIGAGLLLKTVHNLTALQVLDILWRQAMY